MKRITIKFLLLLTALTGCLCIGWGIGQNITGETEAPLSVIKAVSGAIVMVVAGYFFFNMDDITPNKAGEIPGPPEGLQIGDVVNLKVSAHPKMVINYRTMSGYGCCWFDDGLVCQEHVFAEDALVLFKKNEG